MDKVVGLNGGSVPVLEADAEFVSELEVLLEMARSGEIVSGCMAFVYRDDCTGWRILGSRTGRGLLGSVCLMKRAIEDSLLG